MAYIALIVEDVIINKWELTEDVVILGRTSDCDIQIDDQSVSSKHARIVSENDPFMDNIKNYYIEDLKSTNGTRLNNDVISKEKLSEGDVIKIGFTQFQYVDSKNTNLDETAVILT